MIINFLSIHALFFPFFETYRIIASLAFFISSYLKFFKYVSVTFTDECPKASQISCSEKLQYLARVAQVWRVVYELTLVITPHRGSPDKSGGKFFNSIENLHLCTMNNQGLLALAQLILPSEILSNFEVVRVEEEASLIRIYLDESVKAEYKENPEIESKGFCEAVTIRDFPIRDKGVDLIVRRRKWYDKQNNRYFSDSYDLKAEETRYSKEFAAFLKGVYGDDSYDLPFA